MGDWDNLEGQMSIFDFPEYLPGAEIELDDFKTMPIEHAAELIGNAIGYKFKHDEYLEYFEAYPHPKVRLRIYFGNFKDTGERYISAGIEKLCDNKTGASGPQNSIDKAIAFYKRNIPIWLDDVEGNCRYSHHKCNKQSLWQVADELTACPHTCCRNCQNSDCGARCNGAEIKRVDIRGLCDDAYCPTCGHSIDDKDLNKPCKECGQVIDYSWYYEMNSDFEPDAIDNLGLSREATRLLISAGIGTISALMETDEDSLVKIRGMGRRSLAEIMTKVNYRRENNDQSGN